MNETLFALVLVFSPTPQYSTETVEYRNLPFAVCDKAQRAVWAMEAPTIGYDEFGHHIPAFDAYCMDMRQAPTEQVTTTFFY